MNKVKLVINCCSKCPYFSNEYYSYNEECTLLGVKIQAYNGNDFKASYPIPDSCPLQKTDEPVTEGN